MRRPWDESPPEEPTHPLACDCDGCIEYDRRELNRREREQAMADAGVDTIEEARGDR